MNGLKNGIYLATLSFKRRYFSLPIISITIINSNVDLPIFLLNITVAYTPPRQFIEINKQE